MDVSISRPATDAAREWQTYWKAHGQPWRRAPEITTERQHALAQRRATITPDIERGSYPMKGEHLTRADVEWLLATHENQGTSGPLEWSVVTQTRGQGLDLRGAVLDGVDLHDLPLDGLIGGLTFDEFWNRPPDIIEAAAIHLTNAKLEYVSLRGALLLGAHLEHANLRHAHLERAVLYGCHLEGAFVSLANLAGANLRRTTMDAHTNLYKVVLTEKAFGNVSLRDVQWNGADITVMDWARLPYLGDERRARKPRAREPRDRELHARERDFENASRANHQIATLLRAQGLSQHADRFAYRAQRWQRAIYWQQRLILPAVGSLSLDLLAGYGYKPGRTLLIYLAIVLGFAATYFAVLAPASGIALSPLAALVFSVSSFHGRGFFPGPNIPLDAPITVMAAAEAIVGLLIEISFIATFTQRFFSR